MRDEQAVLFANEAFYQAFTDRDIVAMEEVWAREAPVACIHPGWEALEGRDAVMASWRAILENPGAPKIRCTEPRVRLYDEWATIVCYEGIGDDWLVATNIFVKEEAVWRLVHHQAGPTHHRPIDSDSDAVPLH